MIGLGLWLRTTSVPYLALASVATVLGLAGVFRARAGRWGLLGVGLLAGCAIVSAVSARQLFRVDTGWPSYSARVSASALSALGRAVDAEVRTLGPMGASALHAREDPGVAFGDLEAALGSAPPPYRGVVLFRDTAPLAWAGDVRVPVETTDGVGVQVTPFYVALAVTARSGIRRVVTSSLLHAEPPANHLARALDQDITRSAELRGFEYRAAITSDSGWTILEAEGRPLVSVRPVPLSQGEARERVVQRGRLASATLLALAIVVLIGLAWTRPAPLWRRLAALAVGVATVAIVPFNAFSNVSRIFDPAVYFAPLGGALTGSVAALAATSGLALLACLLLARARVKFGPRWVAMVALIVVASLGPFLLRDMARGITLPARGVTATLWLAWQVSLFLAASATLLVGAGAGHLALAGKRGLSPAVAPLIAAGAAAAAVPLWQAPGRFPEWYTIFWIAATVALAVARRSRGFVFAAGVVAACGAATLMWATISHKRVELAQSDVAQLSVPDSSSLDLLERFANALDSGPPPMERSDLLLRYVRSSLAAAGHPVGLASWVPGDSQPYAELLIADFEHHPDAERTLVRDARQSDRRVSRMERSPQGLQTMLAVPHADGSVTTVVVAPRTLLIPQDPFTSLIGLGPPATTEPPYDVTVTTLPSLVPLTDRPRWRRRGNELHGDWNIPGATDSARVHVEVELRGLDVLFPRGALVVLLDLLILSVLWTLTLAADGALWRWARGRVRRWRRSYRSRLTVTFFAFFVIPAVGFAVWSYGRLQATDAESRALLVRETLRTVSAAGNFDRLDELSDRFDIPLFEYEAGALRHASDSLYGILAPVGRYLPTDVARALIVGSEVTAVARPPVAGRPTLFGYRVVVRETGGRAVVAAPARASERALDREREDIGMLVLFVTSLGALAALWLSGLAARELERPVGVLREAALRIARGARSPGSSLRPAEEFVPVFQAFERMDAELAASRDALQEARRRTEAVLRDVASGVIATDREGRITIANPSGEAILGHAITPGMTLADVGAGALETLTHEFLSGSDETRAFVLEIGARQLRGRLTRLAWGPGGAVLTLDDVTELVRAQRVLAWGEMARQVAHEIKNPLTPIRLGVQHLRRARHDPRVDFDRVLEQNAIRILEEIDRLDEIARAFSRYGAAPADHVPPERVDVASVVRKVVDLERMGVSDVRWHHAEADDSVYVLARASELRDVLLNLLENARQAHARNVTVSVEPRDGNIDVVVADDGDGIPAEYVSRVFDPHFSTRTSGSGLGLAISRSLVASWGGEMRVSSIAGKGTEMRVTLKAVEE